MISRAKPNNVTGLIVQLTDTGEKDKLAVLVTGEGRLFVTFRGVRAQNAKLKRFAAPFVLADFTLCGTTVTGASLRDAHAKLSADVFRACSAAIIAEALLKCAEEGADFQEEMSLSLVALKTAEGAETFPFTVALWYLTKLFILEGVDFREYPLTEAVRSLFFALETRSASEIDAFDATEGEILNGLFSAEKVFANVLGAPLKSVEEAKKLYSSQI